MQHKCIQRFQSGNFKLEIIDRDKYGLKEDLMGQWKVKWPQRAGHEQARVGPLFPSQQVVTGHTWPSSPTCPWTRETCPLSPDFWNLKCAVFRGPFLYQFVWSVNVVVSVTKVGYWLIFIFIGPRSDHSLRMSLTDSLTHSLTTLLKLDVTALLKIEWIDPYSI